MNKTEQKSDKVKQHKFMAAYSPIHDRFELFCQASASGVIDQKDLMNEALFRAYNSWDKIKDKDALLYFLFGIVKNILLNFRRKKKEVIVDSNKIDHLTIDNEAERDFEIEFLYKQLDKLSPEKKEAILLFEVAGFSIKEIAKIQESSVGSINMRLSRGRKELKELLMDEANLNSK